MKSTLTIFIFYLFLFNFSLAAQVEIDWLELTEEPGEDGTFELFASNSGHCPLTVVLDFDKLKNVKVKQNLPVRSVVPNGGERVLLATLIPQKNKSTEYNVKLAYFLGNTIKTKHDDDYIYLLPFEKGKKSVIGQGYNGKFSHTGINAIDFDMKEGTKVCASRAGVVVAIKEDSDEGCKSSRCKSLANYVLIYHDDGTFASYVHLKKDGALVDAGEKVKAGQVIGLSGNTGWSSGPHLHFEVYIPREGDNVGVKTKFWIEDEKAGHLQEKKSYTAIHP